MPYLDKAESDAGIAGVRNLLDATGLDVAPVYYDEQEDKCGAWLGLSYMNL